MSESPHDQPPIVRTAVPVVIVPATPRMLRERRRYASIAMPLLRARPSGKRCIFSILPVVLFVTRLYLFSRGFQGACKAPWRGAGQGRLGGFQGPPSPSPRRRRR